MNEKEFKAVNELEKGKDYISVSESVIVIDRKGNSNNNGFEYSNFVGNIACDHPIFWREATHEEVKKRFETYLAKRYGADWKTMKIKERHPDSVLEINGGSLDVDISKWSDGWGVYNENGLLYCNGIWVERLEEEVNSLGVNPEAWYELVKDAPQSTFGQKLEMAIQPIEFINKNGLSFIQGNIIDYVCRYKSKGDIQDLQKAKHYIDLLIELEGD